MHMHDIIGLHMDRLRHAIPGVSEGGLSILETGTIRQDTEAHRQGDGWSTAAFAMDCKGRSEGHVTSIDLDTSVAEVVLARLGLRDHVTLRQGHSIEWMASMLEAGQRFDVILLDSDNDGQLILHEWFLATKLLRRPGLIMVDDVVPGSVTVVKGEQLVPMLDQRGIDYSITERRGGGVVSGVLAAILR